jgi:hypothetical protein
VSHRGSIASRSRALRAHRRPLEACAAAGLPSAARSTAVGDGASSGAAPGGLGVPGTRHQGRVDGVHTRVARDRVTHVRQRTQLMSSHPSGAPKSAAHRPIIQATRCRFCSRETPHLAVASSSRTRDVPPAGSHGPQLVGGGRPSRTQGASIYRLVDTATDRHIHTRTRIGQSRCCRGGFRGVRFATLASMRRDINLSTCRLSASSMHGGGRSDSAGGFGDDDGDASHLGGGHGAGVA